MKYADLHVHTNFSDGTFTPEEVVRYAKQKELACIAICDHDCVGGVVEIGNPRNIFAWANYLAQFAPFFPVKRSIYRQLFSTMQSVSVNNK